MTSHAGDLIPPKKPRTLVDVDNPDDGEIVEAVDGGDPDQEEMPEIEVPEIELPDDGADILENRAPSDPCGGRVFRNVREEE